MLLQDVLKEFVFDCKLRKMSGRTTEGYHSNNARFFRYIDSQFQITELEQVNHALVKAYIQYLINSEKRNLTNL